MNTYPEWKVLTIFEEQVTLAPDMLENYDPQQFKPDFARFHRDFEEFFSSPLMQERCHVSVEIEKPAAMILERPAIQWFGDRFAEHRFRQAFGHVLRHVMIVLGYEVDKTMARITNGVYLTRGARYRIAAKSKKLVS